MASVGGSGYVGINNRPESLGDSGLGGFGVPQPSTAFYSRLHTDQYPDDAMTQNFATMLLGIALRILHPDMTRREEMMMYGQMPAPGVSEENLRSPNVSPLAIRRMG